MLIPKVLRLAVAFVSLAVPLGASDKGQSVGAEERVVWAGATPLFIPASKLLNAAGEVDLSYFQSDGARRALRQLLSDAQNRTVGTCAPYSIKETVDTFGWGSKGSRAPAQERTEPGPLWLQRVMRSGIAATGRVISIVPGYSWRTSAPANLVSVRLEKVYRQRYGTPRSVGDVVSYITGSGSLTINGIPVCMARAGEPSVEVGQQVIVSGFPNEGDNTPLDIDTSTDVLPIDRLGNVVLPLEHGVHPVRPAKEIDAEVDGATASSRGPQ